MTVDPKLWWYVARASGVTAMVLASSSVVWGVALSSRLTRRPRPAWVLDLHRYLGGLTVTFVGVHLGGLVADNFTHWGLSDLFVPLATNWHPIPVAFGIVGFYLLIAVEITSLLMKRLPRRVWYAIHLSSYGLWVLAMVHSFTAGTDRHAAWFLATLAIPGVAVVVITLFRWFTRGSERRPRKRAGTRTPATA
jgi:sulfoxide reductase heme-binding subunit YedZ